MGGFFHSKKIRFFLTAGSGLFCLLFFGSVAQAARTPILMYHYVSVPPATTTLPSLYLRPEIFENQLQELNKHKYNILFVSKIAESLHQNEKLPACSLALTFDDGYEDFYTQVFPLLKKYQIKGTLYVIINRLDTPGYVTKAQIKEMVASGLVEIGSHTFNHPDLRIKKTKDANFEIRESRKVLQEISGQEIKTLAYPYGYFNLEHEKIASSSAYLGAVSVAAGSEQNLKNIWSLYRLRPGNRSGSVFNVWLRSWF